MPREILIDLQYTKTYKTKINMEREIAKLAIPASVRFITYLTEDNRFTPIFFLSLQDPKQSPCLPYLAHRGFKVVG